LVVKLYQFGFLQQCNLHFGRSCINNEFFFHRKFILPGTGIVLWCGLSMW
jgi:hypothetical protein